jgi:hypothetical protein
MAAMAQPPAKPASAAVAAFLQQAAALPALRTGPDRRARLLFGIDATASRQPSWDRACHVQAEMFHATAALGGIEVQLAYFRGHREFAATPFLADPVELARRMAGVACLGGQTQLGRLLDHALAETRRQRVQALVFIGDALEEAPAPLCRQAGELGLRGTPVFAFHEGPGAAAAFSEIARASGGAAAPFDSGAPGALAGLLRAVATYAAGGREALARLPGAAAQGLVRQLR